MQEISEPVMERVILPIASVVSQVSTAVRRLQHGRLQAYIFYVAVGLVAFGVLVWLVSTP